MPAVHRMIRRARRPALAGDRVYRHLLLPLPVPDRRGDGAAPRRADTGAHPGTTRLTRPPARAARARRASGPIGPIGRFAQGGWDCGTRAGSQLVRSKDLLPNEPGITPAGQVSSG
jgi:hypothetical protein